MRTIRRGKYEIRLGRDGADIAAAQALRQMVFRGVRGAGGDEGLDRDRYDDLADHAVICELASGDVVGCFRLALFHGQEVSSAYTAAYYDLRGLAAYRLPMLELGRFCLRPECHDPDILRLAWAAITEQVDRAGVGLLFGASSFMGADLARHAAGLAVLAGRVAPAEWALGRGATESLPLCDLPPARANPLLLPPLLRSYLQMGAWVSDHVVIDRALDTLHVFTGLEIAAIPTARARILRQMVGENS